MSEGTVHPLAQSVGRTHAAGAFDWRAVPSADPRASAFALDTAPALPAAAEEFSGEACREIVEDLLDRTRTGAAVAEVHAPFCESKCDGCGCWQHAYKELESRRWADALVREMAAWADTHAQAGAPIQALRFGGGTPSALEPVDILHVLAKARQYLPLSNDCSIELQARVKSQLRRYMQLGGGKTQSDVYSVGGIVLNPITKEVTLDSDPIALTRIEYNILLFLMQHVGQSFTPREIYQNVWHDNAYGEESTVAVHIRHLREKIEYNPAEPRYLKAVWGRGYKLDNN